MQILPGGETTFLLLFGLFLAVLAVHFVLRALKVLRLGRRGARAEGRCAERRVRSGSSVGSAQRVEYVFCFHTADGREIVFQDASPRLTGYDVGAPVTVWYDPEAPDRHATVAGRGGRWPLFRPLLFGVALAACSALLLGFYVLAVDWL